MASRERSKPHRDAIFWSIRVLIDCLDLGDADMLVFFAEKILRKARHCKIIEDKIRERNAKIEAIKKKADTEIARIRNEPII